jgi:hypothetical protein
MITPTYQLIMRNGPTPGLVYDLVKPELTIGRDMTNDFVINDAEVSRKHVVFRLEAGSYVIEDQGSTNGTFIDGQRLIGPHSMSVGEVITLGENVQLAFEAIRPDLAATMIGTMAGTLPPASVTYPQPVNQPSEQPVYVVPPAPSSPVKVLTPTPVNALPPEPEARKSSRGLWALAGCGCLVLLAVLCAAAALAIEYFNLWCTLFGSIIPGC